MAMVECPSCDVQFDLGKRLVGNRFDCAKCGVELEVMSVKDPRVSWAYDSSDSGDDGWDQGDDDDDDDDDEDE